MRLELDREGMALALASLAARASPGSPSGAIELLKRARELMGIAKPPRAERDQVVAAFLALFGAPAGQNDAPAASGDRGA